MYAREDGTIQMEIKCSNIKDDNKHANANEVLLCEYNATTSSQAHDAWNITFEDNKLCQEMKRHAFGVMMIPQEESYTNQVTRQHLRYQIDPF